MAVQQCDGYCGRTSEQVKLVFGPDPYNEEINGDDTPVWLCEDCHYASADEI